MLKKDLLFVALCLILLFMIPTETAYAYLDPGSTSLIIQVAIAGILGLLAAARIFKDSIFSFLGFKRPKQDESDDDTTDHDDDTNQ